MRASVALCVLWCGCSGQAPPLDELSLRDALLADPAIIVGLGAAERLELADRFEQERERDRASQPVAVAPGSTAAAQVAAIDAPLVVRGEDAFVVARLETAERATLRCDYGVVTSGALGVRFPAGSPAAIDHALRGFVPDGAASLPVHATQLYEAALGLAAALAACAMLRLRARRDGLAFITWISIYAGGRFANELLRGDAVRGAYFGISTAQWVSLCVLAICATLVATRRSAPALADRLL